MINPVQGFKEASAPKKAAMVAGAAVGAAAVASLAYAGVKGGAGKAIVDVFKKSAKAEGEAAGAGLKDKLADVGKAFGKGYRELGTSISGKYAAAKNWVVDHAPKFGKKAAEVTEEVVDAAAGAASEIA